MIWPVPFVSYWMWRINVSSLQCGVFCDCIIPIWEQIQNYFVSFGMPLRSALSQQCFYSARGNGEWDTINLHFNLLNKWTLNGFGVYLQFHPIRMTSSVCWIWNEIHLGMQTHKLLTSCRWFIHCQLSPWYFTVGESISDADLSRGFINFNSFGYHWAVFVILLSN